MRKRWNLLSVTKINVERLENSLHIHPSLCKVLIQRGHDTVEKAQNFLNPSLSNLHDPFLMKDMEKVIERIIQAVDQKETILIYGDYDVDGVTSVALMFDFLNKLSPNKIIYYIPQRKKDGYGLSVTGINFAKERGASLIITVDCGIQGNEEVDYANQLNIETIICDHHLPEKAVPNAYAILNPKQNGCDYPNKELSGCAIGFKIIQAFQIKNDAYNAQELLNYLDLVILSIACDIVPITGENRVLAHFGLKRLNAKPRLGIRFLIQTSQKSFPLTITDVVFGIGPLINAAGRHSNADPALKLLLSNHKIEASDNLNVLKYRNKTRKEIQQKIFAEAIKMVDDSKSSIILFQDDWDIGVLGIIASKICETYYKPAIILTKKDGLLTGSARSIAGADVHHALTECRDLLETFGGHKYAAGVKLYPENLSQFIEAFDQSISNQVKGLDTFEKINISSKLQLSEINASFWHDLKRIAPFGPGNRNPIFTSVNVSDNGKSKIVGEDHIKLSISQGDSKSVQGIAFKQKEKLNLIQNKTFDICYNIKENIWSGKSNLNLQIKDIK